MTFRLSPGAGSPFESEALEYSLTQIRGLDEDKRYRYTPRMRFGSSLFILSALSFLTGFIQADDRPNIIFFFADDQRNTSLGCAGNPVVKTPNVDALAENGVYFTNSFVNTSVCWVSRGTQLTGRVARSFSTPTQPDRVKDVALEGIVPDQLRSAGYKVGLFGKWHLKFESDFTPEDHYDVFERIWRNPYFHELPDGTKRHETQIIGDRAVDFIDGYEGDEPFMLNLWFNAAHAEDGDKRPGIGHFPWPKVTDGMYEDQDAFQACPNFILVTASKEMQCGVGGYGSARAVFLRWWWWGWWGEVVRCIDAS